MHKRAAFTLIELLVVISIIALLIAILLPALGAARTAARQMQSSTQVRGIQQGIYIASQENDGLYPGVVEVTTQSTQAFLDASKVEKYASGGPQAGSHVGARWCLLYEGDFFTPSYGFSPGETEQDKLTEFDPDANNNAYNINTYLTSYALPQLVRTASQTASGRIREWSDSANSSAVVVTDRLIGGINSQPQTHSSIWSDDPGQWSGSVSFNDNHTEFFSGGSEIETTAYAGKRNELPDNLFADNPPGEQNNVNHSNAKQVIRGQSTARIP